MFAVLISQELIGDVIALPAWTSCQLATVLTYASSNPSLHRLHLSVTLIKRSTSTCEILCLSFPLRALSVSPDSGAHSSTSLSVSISKPFGPPDWVLISIRLSWCAWYSLSWEYILRTGSNSDFRFRFSKFYFIMVTSTKLHEIYYKV